MSMSGRALPAGADPRTWRIGFVGYGEVGRILSEDLRAQGFVVSAFDIKLGSSAQSPLREHAAAHGVRLADHVAALTAEADFIISAVTASQAVAVAEACAVTISPGVFFLDFNSASPGA